MCLAVGKPREQRREGVREEGRRVKEGEKMDGRKYGKKYEQKE